MVVAEAQSPPDGQLLAAARSGDRDAFACLIDRHKDPLVRFLQRLTGSHDRAEDLAQEAFLRLHQRGGAYREQGQLRSYLFRIAVNLLRSRERQARRRELLRTAFLPGDGHRTPPSQEQRVLADELAGQLRQALAELPLRFRTPLVLFEIEGWSYREIGELTGCREGTVKSRIYRGRQRLKDRLRPYWEAGATT